MNLTLNSSLLRMPDGVHKVGETRIGDNNAVIEYSNCKRVRVRSTKEQRPQVPVHLCPSKYPG